MLPDDRKYSTEHEWVLLQGDLCLIGITDHAQSELGDITIVELPEVDDMLSAGDDLAVVESVKAASTVFCPIAGKVLEVNTALQDAPEQLNEAPYDAWIAKVRFEDAALPDTLMDAADYAAFLEQK